MTIFALPYTDFGEPKGPARELVHLASLAMTVFSLLLSFTASSRHANQPLSLP